MVITPDRFSEIGTRELLGALAAGRVGFDHRAIHALVDEPDRTLPEIVRWCLEEHEGQEYDVTDELVSILRHLRRPEAIPALIAIIRHDPLVLSDDLPDALYLFRHEALEPLLALYNELEEEDSAEVAFLLASFRIPDPRVRELLISRLEYDAEDAAICLGLYGDPEARPALEKLLSELEEDDGKLKRSVEEALSELGRQEDVPEDDTWGVWSQFPERSLPEFEALEEDERLQLLDCSDAEYRLGAAASFVNQALPLQAREKLLEHARNDEDRVVRGKCWEALADAAGDEDVAEAMLACVADESLDPRERSGALVALATEAEERGITQYFEEFYARPETRAAALKAMWTSMDRSFADYFPKHLDDADPEVKKQAIAGVGYLGIHGSAEALKKFFADEEFRPNALFAYALSVRAEISRGRIRSLQRKIEDAAGGTSEEEQELIEIALDERLLLQGHRPVFHPDRYEDVEGLAEEESGGPVTFTAGRNDPCPCGSGKKFKKCCGSAEASPTGSAKVP